MPSFASTLNVVWFVRIKSGVVHRPNWWVWLRGEVSSINRACIGRERCFKAWVHVNLSEILPSLRDGWKKIKSFGTPPDSWMPRKGSPGWWETIWCTSTIFYHEIIIFKQHQNFQISYLHKFNLSYEKTYLNPNVPKHHQTIYKKTRNVDMWYEHRDFWLLEMWTRYMR